MSKRSFLLSSLAAVLLCCSASKPAETMKIDPDARLQEHEGWGVSLCWWAYMCGQWDEAKIDSIVDYLVLPEHLNYNIFRYNIGGGDDPQHRHCSPGHIARGKGPRAEMPGFKAYEDSEYDWDADSAQIKIMRKIKERRPDAIFEAFSNSAPWWMTISGCCAGADSATSDNLSLERYADFARYLVDVCKHHKDEYGIEFRTLDPFNEPMTDYWYRDGSQEGCHFDVESMIEVIKVLHPMLQESGLSTAISASDETDVRQAVRDFEAFKAAGVLPLLGQWNVHTYEGDDTSRIATRQQCADAGMRLWMSEVGAGGRGMRGNLMLASKLIKDIQLLQPAAWVDWQYIDDGGDQWCLMHANYAKQRFHLINNYYVRQHFSKYIKPGYVFLVSADPSTLVATNPDGTELVIVSINTERTASERRFDLSLFPSASAPEVALVSEDRKPMQPLRAALASGNLSFTLPALSAATVVLPLGEKK